MNDKSFPRSGLLTFSQYTINYFQTDILYVAETQPEILITGCNQGKVDTFNAIDVSALTGGAYTSALVAKNPVGMNQS